MSNDGAETQRVAAILDGNGGVRDDGHWHAEHCPGAPAFPCHCAVIENEMFDYLMVMRHCAQIYDEVTRGRISKPNTLPSEVIAVMEDLLTEDAREQDAALAAAEARGAELAAVLQGAIQTHGEPCSNKECSFLVLARAALARTPEKAGATQ